VDGGEPHVLFAGQESDVNNLRVFGWTPDARGIVATFSRSAPSTLQLVFRGRQSAIETESWSKK
jgi:hypothetical protein